MNIRRARWFWMSAVIVALVWTALAALGVLAQEDASTTPTAAAVDADITATPVQTATPVPTPEPVRLRVSASEGVRTIALVVHQSFPQITEPYSKPISATVEGIIKRMGYEVVGPDVEANAKLAITLTLRTLECIISINRGGSG